MRTKITKEEARLKRFEKPAIGEVELREGELWKTDDYATINEVEKETENENGLRLYCTQYPNGFNLQIRTHKPITDSTTGTARDMVANIGLSKKDITALYEYVINYEKNN